MCVERLVKDGHLDVEATLDPDDWEAMRALGHRMIDAMLEHLETIREHPVWQPIPEAVQNRFRQPLPHEPQGPDATYEDFLCDVQPYPLGNIHPRFWGWVTGTGTPFGMLAEMLAAGLNPNVAGAEHIAVYVETQVIAWCKEMLGYPMEASGVLVSGASMANLIGLTVARNTITELDIRYQGLQNAPQYLTVYGSCEMHSSLQRAVELLGLGSKALRRIPVNSDFQIDIKALEATIQADRSAGYRPMCVVGNAGTVNTGAFDDLNALATLCEREGIWFHVDGAFGALAELSPSLRHYTAGMQRADSLGFDLHKWMHIPHEAACVLVRNREAHRNAFTLRPDYLEQFDRGVAAGEIWYGDYGIQLSRSFRSLKVWMSIKEHGIDKYGALIQQNVEQAQYLAMLIDNAPELERLAPVSLNIVCFRYRAANIDDEKLNNLNKILLIQLQESGAAVPSHTVLNGKYALRVAVTNHRSKLADFEFLVDEVIRLGRHLICDVLVRT